MYIQKRLACGFSLSVEPISISPQNSKIRTLKLILLKQGWTGVLVLSVYTWAMLQFALVIAQTEEDIDTEPCTEIYVQAAIPTAATTPTTTPTTTTTTTIPTTNVDVETSESAEKPRKLQPDATKLDMQIFHKQNNCPKESSNNSSGCGWSSDLAEMFVALLMQDGPFLAVRMYLCSTHQLSDVTNDPHIFFLCKNAFICVLYLYRFAVLVCDKN